ncbi:hypothetical protein FWK35_00027922, partial [Aphis craccivora]
FVCHESINSEQSEECIDFTMIITSRNNAPISNYGVVSNVKVNIVIDTKKPPICLNLFFQERRKTFKKIANHQ